MTDRLPAPIDQPLQILGTDELFNYLDKYDLELDPHFDGIMGRHSNRPWQRFVNVENQHLVSEEAISFVGHVRPTARVTTRFAHCFHENTSRSRSSLVLGDSLPLAYFFFSVLFFCFLYYCSCCPFYIRTFFVFSVLFLFFFFPSIINQVTQRHCSALLPITHPPSTPIILCTLS